MEIGTTYSCLEGDAFTKKKHEKTGVETVGLDIGPQTLAIVSREGKADLVTFCQELETNAREKRRLQRKIPPETRQQSRELRRERACEEAWQDPLTLEREQTVQSNQATVR